MAEPHRPFGPDDFRSALNVSRETLDRLGIYAELLQKWQKAINLVGKSTLPDLWRRHMLDSAQLLIHTARTTGRWIDLGSEPSAGVTVHNCRIEDMEPLEADIISARALAPLEKLLTLAEPFVRKDTELFFLKGQDVDEELTIASKCWNMEIKKLRSLTSEDGCILKISKLRRRS